MILLVSANPEMSALSEAIVELTREEVEMVTSLSRATGRLRRGSYSLVLVDQSMAESGTAEADTLLRHVQSASVLFLNFAISGTERIRWEVQLALRRRQMESDAAREAALASLRGELKDPLAGIILLSELALNHADMSPQMQQTLRQIAQLAQEINDRLAVSAVPAASSSEEAQHPLPN